MISNVMKIVVRIFMFFILNLLLIIYFTNFIFVNFISY